LSLTERAEARDLKRIMVSAAGRGADGVAEGPLAFAAPHDAIDGIAAQIVFGQRLPEGLQPGIVEADGGGALAGERDFQKRLQTVEVASEGILIPAKNLHAARMRLGKNAADHIEIAVVRGLDFLERRMSVVLLVSAGKIAAVVIGVVLLLAVVGKRLPGNLAAGDAASVAVGGKEQRVDADLALKAVEHRRNAFVDER